MKDKQHQVIEFSSSDNIYYIGSSKVVISSCLAEESWAKADNINATQIFNRLSTVSEFSNEEYISQNLLDAINQNTPPETDLYTIKIALCSGRIFTLEPPK